MAIKDFQGKQIRLQRLITSGGFGVDSNLTAQEQKQHSKLGLLIYSASVATDFTGGVNPDVTRASSKGLSGMLEDVGEDVYIFISGSASHTGDPSYSRSDVMLYGGDLVVSGTLFAERVVVEVKDTHAGDLHLSGALEIQPDTGYAVQEQLWVRNSAGESLFVVDAVDDMVGVGLQRPDTVFHVEGPDNTNNQLKLGSYASTYYMTIGVKGSVAGNHRPGDLVISNTDNEIIKYSDVNTILQVTGSMLDVGWDPNTPATAIGATLRLSSHDTAIGDNQDLGKIEFWGGDNTTGNKGVAAKIAAETAAGWGAAGDRPTELQFWTTDDSSSTITQQMVIDRTGKVGIGVVAPATHLEVVTELVEQLRLGYSTSVYMSVQVDSDGDWHLSDSNSDNVFSWQQNTDTGSTPAFIMTASMLDIGWDPNDVTTDTGATLRLSAHDTTIGPSQALGTIEFWGDDDDAEGVAAKIVAEAGTWGTGERTTELQFWTTADGSDAITQRMVITEGGKMGIRTTDPDTTLEINSDDGTNLRLTYADPNGSATNYADFRTTATGDLTITPSGGDITLDSDQLWLGTDTTADTTITIRGTNNDIAFYYDESAQTLALDTNKIFVDATAKKIGIGTGPGTNRLAAELEVRSLTAAPTTTMVTSVAAMSASVAFRKGDNPTGPAAVFDGDEQFVLVHSGSEKKILIKGNASSTSTLGTELFVTGVQFRFHDPSVRVLTPGSQVLFFSGAHAGKEEGVRSRDPTLLRDTNFWVSGSGGSKGTSVRGTATFGGDLHISGNLSLEGDFEGALIPVSEVLQITGSMLDIGWEPDSVGGDDLYPIIRMTSHQSSITRVPAPANVLGELQFAGVENSGTADAAGVGAKITAVAGDAWNADGDRPTSLRFWTNDGTATRDKMKLDMTGALGIRAGGTEGIWPSVPLEVRGIDGVNSAYQFKMSYAQDQHVVMGINGNGRFAMNISNAAGSWPTVEEARRNFFVYDSPTDTLQITGSMLDIGWRTNAAPNLSPTLRLSTRQQGLVDGERLGTIEFYGAAAVFSGEPGVAAQIVAEAADTWGSSAKDRPTELQFWTTNNAGDDMAQRMVITHGGTVGIGTTATAFTPPVNIKLYLNTDNGAAVLQMTRVDTSISKGDQLAAINIGGSTDSESTFDLEGASITVEAAEDWSTPLLTTGTRMRFETTPIGSSTATTRMLIHADWKVGMGDFSSAVPDTELEIYSGGESTVMLTAADPGNSGSIAFRRGTTASTLQALVADDNSDFSLVHSGTNADIFIKGNSSNSGSTELFVTGVHYRFQDIGTGRYGSQVLFLSGAHAPSFPPTTTWVEADGPQSPDPQAFTDTNFWVSGSIGSKNTRRRGTTVFAGDVVISGTLHGGSPLRVGDSQLLSGALFLQTQAAVARSQAGDKEISIYAKNPGTGVQLYQNIGGTETTLGAIMVSSGSNEYTGVTQLSLGEALIVANEGGGVLSLTGSIGVPGDGDWQDSSGLFNSFTSKTPIGTAIDKFNSVLKSLAPSPAPNLGSVNELVTAVDANLSFDGTYTLAGYTNATAATTLTATGVFQATALSNVVINTLYEDTTASSGGFTDYRIGVIPTSTEVTGTLNSAVSADSPNYGPGAYGDGDDGTLQLWVNGLGTVIQSTDLSVATVGAYVNGNGSGFYLSLKHDAHFSNGDAFDLFQHRQSGFVVNNADMRNGWNFAIITHTPTGGSARVTNYVTWVVEANTTDITALGSAFANDGTANPTTADNSSLTGTKTISGVTYHTAASFDYEARFCNAYNNTYSDSSSAITFAASGGASVGTVTTTTEQGANSTLGTGTTQSLPAIAAAAGEGPTKRLNLSGSISAGNEEYYGEDFSVTCTVKHPLSTKANATSISKDINDATGVSGGILLYTVSDDSSVLREKFTSEAYRRVSGSYATQAAVTAEDWDSSDALSDGTGAGMLVFSQAVRPPPLTPDEDGVEDGDFVINTLYSGNPDYSEYTGSSESGRVNYFRYFQNNSGGTQNDFTIRIARKGSPFANCSIVAASAKTADTTATEICVFIKVPGSTGWLDIGLAAPSPQTWNDYDGVREGDLDATVDTGGATNTVNVGTVNIQDDDYIVVKIEAAIGWTSAIDDIQITW